MTKPTNTVTFRLDNSDDCSGFYLICHIIPHHTIPHHMPYHHTIPHAIPHHIPPCHIIPHDFLLLLFPLYQGSLALLKGVGVAVAEGKSNLQHHWLNTNRDDWNLCLIHSQTDNMQVRVMDGRNNQRQTYVRCLRYTPQGLSRDTGR